MKTFLFIFAITVFCISAAAQVSDSQNYGLTDETIGLRPGVTSANAPDPQCDKLKDLDGLGLHNPGLKSVSALAGGDHTSAPAGSIQ